jgi:hypothetical protein
MEMTFLPLILLGAAVLLCPFSLLRAVLLWISAKVSGVNIPDTAIFDAYP